MKRATLITVCVLIAFPLIAAENACIVSGRGHFRIEVYAGGLFGVFAHDHVIEAAKVEGCAAIDTEHIGQSSIKLTFPTADLHVLDPKESTEDRAKVQQTMQTEVLRISEYPRVTFESTAIEPESGSRLRVHGNLTIRGKTQQIVISMTLSDLNDGTHRAAGEYRFKQSAFGINPIQLLGGTVKVKDEVRTEFELYLK